MVESKGRGLSCCRMYFANITPHFLSIPYASNCFWSSALWAVGRSWRLRIYYFSNEDVFSLCSCFNRKYEHKNLRCVWSIISQKWCLLVFVTLAWPITQIYIYKTISAESLKQIFNLLMQLNYYSILFCFYISFKKTDGLSCWSWHVGSVCLVFLSLLDTSSHDR